MTTLTKILACLLALASAELAACAKSERQGSSPTSEDVGYNASDINNQAATKAGESLPEFKIPAPQASAETVLPRSLFPSGQPTLKQVEEARRRRL